MNIYIQPIYYNYSIIIHYNYPSHLPSVQKTAVQLSQLSQKKCACKEKHLFCVDNQSVNEKQARRHDESTVQVE